MSLTSLLSARNPNQCWYATTSLEIYHVSFQDLFWGAFVLSNYTCIILYFRKEMKINMDLLLHRYVPLIPSGSKNKCTFSKNSFWFNLDKVPNPKQTSMVSYVKCYLLNTLTLLVFTMACQVNECISLHIHANT